MRELKAAKDSPQLPDVLIALEAVLEGPDAKAARQALLALATRRELDFIDKTRFHGAVVLHLNSKDPTLRAAAIWALCACGPRADDRNLILPLAEDPDVQVRVALGAGTSRCFQGDCTDPEISRAVLGLLRDQERVVTATIVGLGSARLSSELEARLISLSEDPTHRRRVICEVLTRLRPKSREVIDSLIGFVRSGSGLDGRDAAWGLRTGIPDADRHRVAEAMLPILAEATWGSAGTNCLDLVLAYGDEAQLSVLASLATDLRQPEKKRRVISARLESHHR